SRFFNLSAGISTSRRSQMSGVFHFVPMTAPGVPSVPKPLLPSFHAESSKPAFTHSSVGLVVVYRHVVGALSAAGITVEIFGSGGIGAQPDALVLSRFAHFFHT